MTTTTPDSEATRTNRSARSRSNTASAVDAPEQIAPPPKARRRPALIALSVVLVVVGGLASVFAFQSMSNAQQVLTVRETVHRGEVIEADDLMTLQIGVDPALRAVPAGQRDTVVGKRAALDISAGGVITSEQLTDEPVPGEGQSLVGVSVTAAQLPSGQVRVGDRVRVVAAAGEAGATTSTSSAEVAAVVMGVSTDQVTGNTVVNVQVAHDDAGAVAAQAAAGTAAIVVDSVLDSEEG